MKIVIQIMLTIFLYVVALRASAQSFEIPSEMIDTSRQIGDFYVQQKTDAFTDRVYNSNLISTQDVNSKDVFLTISCVDYGAITKENENDGELDALFQTRFDVGIDFVNVAPGSRNSKIIGEFKYRFDAQPTKIVSAYIRDHPVIRGDRSMGFYSTKQMIFDNQFVSEAIKSEKLFFIFSSQSLRMYSAEFSLRGLSDALKYGGMDDCTRRK